MTTPETAPGQAFSWRDFATRRADIVALVLLFLITIPLLTKIFTSDFGTHLALGRQIVQTRELTDREFLNYPSLGIGNPNMEWGFEAILYLVYAAGGTYGVSFFVWAVIFAVCYFLHRATVLRGANPILAVVAIFAFSGFLRIRIQPRPEILTYLFIAFSIFLLTEYYFGRRKRLIYLFVPMFLVWANIHPTYLIGFVLCGAFFVDALARALWNRELGWDRVKSWAVPPVVVVVLGIVVCGANPHGYQAILAPLKVISRGASGGGGSILMSISELTPVKGTGMFVYYKATVIFAAVSLVLGAMGRRVYLLDLFLFAITFKGSWDSARAVSMMGLFLAPGVSLHLTGFFAYLSDRAAAALPRAAARRNGDSAPAGPGKKHRKGERKEGKPAAAPAPAVRTRPGWARTAVLVLVVVAPVAFGATNLVFSFSQLQYGVGMTEHKFSFEAARFLRKYPISGNMFNFFDIGGFLDWQLYPQALTFIDGRTYNQKVFYDHQVVTGGMPGWEEVVRKYGINYVVIKSMDSSGMILPIVQVLANDPGWSLVFADGLFLIFVRNVPENQAYLRAHELPKSRIPQHIIWESYHYLYLGVSPVLAYQTMSNMYQVLGNMPAAADALRKAIAEYDDPYLRAQLRRLEGGGGGYPPAGMPSGHPPVGERR